MLSINVMTRGEYEYYLNLAGEDYFFHGGEPQGVWVGAGAEAMGLVGIVREDELRNLMEGLSADRSEALVQNAGAEDRQPGWGLTFSAPKSVSVCWALAELTREEVEAAQFEAVKRAISFVEQHAAWTRRGKAGRVRERVGLVVATFEHGTSRALDPQLHTHCLVLNLGVREDGTTGALLSRPLYEYKMVAGAVYRAELARELEKRLALACERDGSGFRIKGVPQELCDLFSKRRQEIQAALKESGLKSAKAAEVATLDTRKAKAQVARSELLMQWRELARQHGLDHMEVSKVAIHLPEKETSALALQCAERAIHLLTEAQGHFSYREFVRAAVKELPGSGLGVDDVVIAFQDLTRSGENVVTLGRVRGELRFTTLEMLEIEEKIKEKVLATSKSETHLVSPQTLDRELGKFPFLTAEQAAALRHLTEQPGSVQVLSGLAGTGKAVVLKAARSCWEREGLHVVGMAVAGKAARGLEENTGIESQTVCKGLWGVELTWRDDVRHGIRQLVRAVLKKPTFWLDKPRIDKRTVVVVDEASLVGTRDMLRLCENVVGRGAKLVLAGDGRQLQAIQAGGTFNAIAQWVGAAELNEIVRQRDAWARDAVVSIARGDGKKAVEEFAKRGLVHVAESREAAMEQLVCEWKKDGARRPQENAILAGRRQDVATLNELAQKERVDAGMLRGEGVQVGDEEILKGDRILFQKNSRFLGVKNGDLGTVTRVDARNAILVVMLDRGTEVEVSLKHYESVCLGYAVTVHKAQGSTVENAFVLVGGFMQDRELSYVQVSRARGMTRIFTDRMEAGDRLYALARAFERSRQKELATEVKRRAERDHERDLETTLA